MKMNYTYLMLINPVLNNSILPNTSLKMKVINPSTNQHTLIDKKQKNAQIPGSKSVFVRNSSKKAIKLLIES